MTYFKLAPHTSRPGDVVELWRDEALIGVLYPHGNESIKIISKYMDVTGIRITSHQPGEVVIPLDLHIK